jgi:HD-GYP domain-containing protein (c-di-GMP phosphodiesterase class II)
VSILAALSRALDSQDPFARGHSVRVTALAETVAFRLGWRDERLLALRVGARLHDIGKLAVPPDVLRKPGRLTPSELAQVREHPRAGARMISALGCFRAALPYVLYHHERWDGGGYPTGKAGDEIPLEARVLAVVDAYDAMTSLRPYRRALDVPEALTEIDRCAGSQFDPEIASLFLDLWRTEQRAAAVG